KFRYKDTEYMVVDLPGTYSLGAYSEDEIIARDYILKGNPDIVINVVDATNIERNLYLTTQLMGMGVNVVIALNMMDEAKHKQMQIDIDKLSNNLGIKVIPTVASKSNGIDDLIKVSISEMGKDETAQVNFSYGERLENEIATIEEMIRELDLEYPS